MVIALEPLPSVGTSNPDVNKCCVVCMRKLMDSSCNLYCSIICKATAMWAEELELELQPESESESEPEPEREASPEPERPRERPVHRRRKGIPRRAAFF